MNNKILAVILVSFFILAGSAGAKDEGAVTAEDVVAKMTTELNLTGEQIKAVTPIIEESMRKRQAFLDSMEEDATIDREAVKMRMHRFQKEENQKLSEVLSQEQMQKLTEKQRLREGLNKDHIDYSEGVGTSGLSGDAATMQF